jgi:hypothetical protein
MIKPRAKIIDVRSVVEFERGVDLVDQDLMSRREYWSNTKDLKVGSSLSSIWKNSRFRNVSLVFFCDN